MVQKLVNVSVADLHRNPTFRSERITQALLGESVELLKRHERFSLVSTCDRSENWIDNLQLCNSRKFPNRLATARSHHFLIHSEPDAAAPKVRDAVIGCKLACSGRQDEWLQVILPDGTAGWAQAEHFGTFPSFGRKAVVALAMEFTGIPTAGVESLPKVWIVRGSYNWYSRYCKGPFPGIPGCNFGIAGEYRNPLPTPNRAISIFSAG